MTQPTILFGGANEIDFLNYNVLLEGNLFSNDLDTISKDLIKKSEVIVLASPCWNGSYTWMLKKLVDDMPYGSFNGKKAYIIVWGGKGLALDVKNELVKLAHNLGMQVMPNFVFLAEDNKNDNQVRINILKENIEAQK